jgi:DNA-directed RNA polymerase subunit RPC12/RpoP
VIGISIIAIRQLNITRLVLGVLAGIFLGGGNGLKNIKNKKASFLGGFDTMKKQEQDKNWRKCEHCGVWIYAITDYLCQDCRRRFELKIQEYRRIRNEGI